MDYATGFAKEFNKRNNKTVPEVTIGKVVKTDPLEISIDDGAVLLNSDIIYKCDNLRTKTISINDNVMCIPTEGGNKYFIVDKVV